MRRKTILCLDCLLLVYIGVILRITIFRAAFSLQGLWQNGTLNLIPFADLVHVLYQQRFFMFLYLFLGNIVWFIPFGMLIRCRFPHWTVRKIVGIGACFSGMIEISQYMFGTGITELDDLLLNTFGVFLGALLLRKIGGKKSIGEGGHDEDSIDTA